MALAFLTRLFGALAELVAKQFVLRRLDDHPFGLMADGDELIGVVGDLVEVVQGDAFKDALRVLQLLPHQLGGLARLVQIIAATGRGVKADQDEKELRENSEGFSSYHLRKRGEIAGA